LTFIAYIKQKMNNLKIAVTYHPHPKIEQHHALNVQFDVRPIPRLLTRLWTSLG